MRELLHLSMPKWAEEFAGIGKPEPLRHMFAGAWSRRITEEHRLVYLVDCDDLVIHQARFHFK